LKNPLKRIQKLSRRVKNSLESLKHAFKKFYESSNNPSTHPLTSLQTPSIILYETLKKPFKKPQQSFDNP